MTVLKRAGVVAAAIVPVSQLARLGYPAILTVVAAAALLAVLVIGVACWVLASDARSRRAERLLGAARRRRR